MKLLVMVLNKADMLDELLTEFVNTGITGATILDSTGMARVLKNHEGEANFDFLRLLSNYLNPERKRNKTILMVLKEEQVQTVIDVTNKTLGGFKDKDSGILFTLPLDYVQGIGE